MSRRAWPRYEFYNLQEIMHRNNLQWFSDLKERYPDSFKNCKVLELGSKSINGTVRIFFENCEYVGVDKDSGDCVDIVIDARETEFQDRYFDTLVCTSMLEHDVDWKESLDINLAWLRAGGMLFLSWGAEGNKFHNPPWQPVPHQEVIDYLKEKGIEVVESFFEEDKYGPDAAGNYNLVARK